MKRLYLLPAVFRQFCGVMFQRFSGFGTGSNASEDNIQF